MVRLRNNILAICLLVSTLLSAQQIHFRGAWIATVANIDWPTEAPVGNTNKQQQEMLFLLDSLQAIGINTIIFQARPTSDAFYLSELEPVSHWLTGRQGSWGQQQAYDPLEFICYEAHKRGMQVHAWLNPYRLNLKQTPQEVYERHPVWKEHPEWFFYYNGMHWMDPGLDETRDWICMVVEDIVSRYAIDGIHMDDYFYPYPAGGKPIPDAATFRANPRGFDNIADWRRHNTNLIIQELHTAIHAIRPECQFGISPFGVWRNAGTAPASAQGDSTRGLSPLAEGSATKAGITNYDDLYADILLWMDSAWIDYVVPQIYWEIGKPIANYEVLAHWWASHAGRCEVYIGMAPYRLGGQKEVSAWRNGNEIARQMRLNRTIPGITGECFYSTRPLLRNPLHVCDSIRAIYQTDLPKIE